MGKPDLEIFRIFLLFCWFILPNVFKKREVFFVFVLSSGWLALFVGQLVPASTTAMCFFFFLEIFLKGCQPTGWSTNMLIDLPLLRCGIDSLQILRSWQVLSFSHLFYLGCVCVRQSYAFVSDFSPFKNHYSDAPSFSDPLPFFFHMKCSLWGSTNPRGGNQVPLRLPMKRRGVFFFALSTSFFFYLFFFSLFWPLWYPRAGSKDHSVLEVPPGRRERWGEGGPSTI